jgi:hypothetical protein
VWTYYIRSGEWVAANGDLLAICHSGRGDAMNDPSRCRERNVGPIPPGFYNIGPAHHHRTCGPVAMRLIPMPGTDTFGRSGFLVHGPNRTPALEDDSEGCPIMPFGERCQLALSQDRVVEVVDERPVSSPLDPTTYTEST